MKPSQIWIASLERSGALKIDDPVKIRGYTVGKITDMKPSGETVYVHMSFSHPVSIYSNYRLKMSEKGVFGKRFFTLFPGDPKFNRLDNSQDTLNARFLPGISEVMGLAWKLEQSVNRITLLLKDLEKGTDEKASFQKSFNDIVHMIDSLTDKFDNSLTSLNMNLSRQLDTLRSITSFAEDQLATISALTPEFLSKLTESLTELEQIVDKIQKPFKDLMGITESLEKQGSKSPDEKIENLINTLAELKKGLKQLKNNAGRLKLRISRLKD